jgi:hypothetical protein
VLHWRSVSVSVNRGDRQCGTGSYRGKGLMLVDCVAITAHGAVLHKRGEVQRRFYRRDMKRSVLV